MRACILKRRQVGSISAMGPSLLLSLALQLANPVLAQSALQASSGRQSPSTDSITIIGERTNQARQQSEAYLRELGVAIGDHPTARWFDPICPRAIGLNQANATIVEMQVRGTIAKVGARLAGASCAQNFLIVFADDGAGLVQMLKRREASVGSELPPPALRELTRGAAPVRWWYNTEVRSRDGSATTSVVPPGVQVETVGGVGTLPTSGESLSIYGSSIVSTQTVRTIRSAVVVVDVQRSEGIRLKPVIDYTSLVGLAEIRQGAEPFGSVLSLFSGSAGAQGSRRAFCVFLKDCIAFPWTVLRHSSAAPWLVQ